MNTPPDTINITQEELEVWQDRAQLALKNFWYFLKYFTWTKDEHDWTVLYKGFPVKAMYRMLYRAVMEFDLLIIEKSRQIMLTWFMVTYCLWAAMTRYNQLILFQSKKQEDADPLIERSRNVYDALEAITLPLFGQWFPSVRKVGLRSGIDSEFEFPSMHGKIWAIPQGGAIVRSHTPSILFADEMDYQPEFQDGYDAAQPAVNGGGQYIAVGSVNGKAPSYFIINGLDEITEEPLGAHLIDSSRAVKAFEPPPELSPAQARYWIEDKIVNLPEDEFFAIPYEQLAASMPGFHYHRTCKSIDCLVVDFFADPDKDPITTEGAEWVRRTKARMSRSGWEREMLRNRNVFVGRPVIRDFDRDKFVRPLVYDEGLPLRLTHDFGTILCLTFFAQYGPPILDDGSLGEGMQLRFLRELILKNSNTPTLASETRKILERQFRPSLETRNIRSFCDPTGDRQQDTTSDKSLNTSIKVLNAYGIYPSSKKFGVPESTELMETVFEVTLPCGQPAVLIDPSCEYLISCFVGGLRYPEKKPGRALETGYYEKDGYYDHGGDGARYMIANAFSQYILTGQKEPQYGASDVIREPYTGRVIGLRRDNGRRRVHREWGEHYVHTH